ncbi:MAG: STAS/SEC14 domain-containing protein [Janthinobacterium lividum]
MLPPGLTFTNRPDLPAVIARWQREVTPDELQAGYEALLQTADAAGCSRWLLDLRRRQDLADTGINNWFSHVFTPLLHGRYSQPVRLAFLISPLRSQQTVTAIVSPTDSDCEIATFTDEATAHQWLARA